MNEEQLTELLTSKFGWKRNQVQVGLATHFQCAYCGKDLIADAETSGYDYIVEHIVPLSKRGADEPANLTATCRMCNTLKGRSWDPRDVAGRNASRAELMVAARIHVSRQRRLREIRFTGERQAITQYYLEQANNTR